MHPLAGCVRTPRQFVESSGTLAIGPRSPSSCPASGASSTAAMTRRGSPRSLEPRSTSARRPAGSPTSRPCSPQPGPQAPWASATPGGRPMAAPRRPMPIPTSIATPSWPSSTTASSRIIGSAAKPWPPRATAFAPRPTPRSSPISSSATRPTAWPPPSSAPPATSAAPSPSPVSPAPPLTPSSPSAAAAPPSSSATGAARCSSPPTSPPCSPSESLAEGLARLPVGVDIASEFRYRRPVLDSRVLTVPISQSGETADTLAALREAKDQGSRAVAICNVVGSSLAREADGVVYTRAGLEIGVASTKAFTAQLVAVTLLALKLGLARNFADPALVRQVIKGLAELPDLLAVVLQQSDAIRRIAQRFVDSQHFLYLGRGLNYPLALDGALKLLSYHLGALRGADVDQPRNLANSVTVE